jgi:cysteine desulfurase / selenocysteine lyase
MISHVGDQDTSWNELPWKLEAGTPNIAGALGLGRAIDYLEAVGMKNIHEYENEIGRYALEQLSKISGVTIVGPSDMTDRGAVFSFEVEGIHPHDLATFLDTKGVAIRAGHHCAQPLLRKLGVQATARASFYFYNTKSEVELLVETLMEAQKYFSKGKS